MNKKIIIYSLGGVALAVGGYFLYKKLTQETIYFGEVEEEEETEVKPKKTKKDDFPLKKGSKGKNVESLQRFLKDEGLGSLLGTFGKNKDGVDGDFGRMTENAVKTQQTPFATFQISFPKAKFGEVSEEYFNMFIKGKY